MRLLPANNKGESNKFQPCIMWGYLMGFQGMRQFIAVGPIPSAGVVVYQPGIPGPADDPADVEE